MEMLSYHYIDLHICTHCCHVVMVLSHAAFVSIPFDACIARAWQRRWFRMEI